MSFQASKAMGWAGWLNVLADKTTKGGQGGLLANEIKRLGF